MFTFLNTDCKEALKNIPAKSIDLVLTDPPYGITGNKWDAKEDGEAIIEIWPELLRVVKDNGAILVFGRDRFNAKLITNDPKNFRYQWTWVKNASSGFLNSKRMPMKAVENINVFYKRLPTYNPQMTKGQPYTVRPTKCSSNYHIHQRVPTVNTTGDRYPTDVLYFKTANNSKSSHMHPTQKPVDLLEYLVKTYTNEGDTVLDPFSGSCSCGHACLNTNRNFVGFERDPEYYEKAMSFFPDEVRKCS